MKLVGASGKSVATGLEKQNGIVNYYVGNDPTKWRTRVPTYARAKLAGVYPGIDVVYYGVSGERGEARGKALSTHHSSLTTNLEYDLTVRPGADPGSVRLAFEGVDGISVSGGDLVMATPAGRIKMRRPYAYQQTSGRRTPVACEYRILGGREAAAPACAVGFKVARYDRSRPLTIDPVLVYSTVAGGASADGVTGMAVDAAGSAYVTGYTYGSDFPTTPGAYDASANGDLDAYVLKLAPDGASLAYCTYLGGTDWDYAHAIAVDGAGSAYVAGETGSPDFPTTVGAFQPSLNGTEGDAFLLKLDPGGGTLGYGTYFGGAEWDGAYAVCVRTGGAACIAGYTLSADTPVTVGAYDATYNGGLDAFVARLSADGSALECGTYLGGTADDTALGVRADSSGALYVCGNTYSTDYPTTPGAFSVAFNGGSSDAFLTKVSADGSSLSYSTLLGGSGNEAAFGVALDGAGAAFVVGETTSANYPTTTGAFDTTRSGGSDGFVTCVGAAGNSLVYSTFMGGSDWDGCFAVALDSTGRACVTGYTYSTDFPLTADAFDTELITGDADAFLTYIEPGGGLLALSSYVGGSGSETGYAAAVDLAGAAYVAGDTWSSDFPTTAGAFDPTQNGEADGFIVKAALSARIDTALYTVDRSGTITETVALRSYDLKRLSDNALLSGKTITYKVDGTVVGTATTDTGGDSSLNWTIAEGPASRTITAEFAGDPAYNGCSDDAILTCLSWTTKMATFDRTARITDRTELKCRLLRSDNVPLYNKGVSFSVDGTFVMTRPTNTEGYASYPYYDVPDGSGAGVRTILSEWPGNGGYAAIGKTATLTVLRAIPYIWVLPKTVPRGAIANLYAYVRRLYDYKKQEAKPVTFRLDGTWIADVVTGTADQGGVARYLYPTTEGVGVHTIRCEFAGDAWLDPGYGEANLTIY